LSRREKFIERMQTAGAKKSIPGQKKAFTINTYYCRGELETIQELIEKNAWDEAFGSTMKGHMMWFGLALRETDLNLIKKRSKMYFNRYAGTEVSQFMFISLVFSKEKGAVFCAKSDEKNIPRSLQLRATRILDARG